MARIDPNRAHIVVRLVYDGPAMAGKTTSLRALARSLGVGMFSGAEEDGRTLYLDWVDYVGGLFEGMPIRCQIVSVPGQAVLENRRRELLQSADAVIFVADSRPERMAENRRSYEVLCEIASVADIPIGIVVQANKRDCPDAASLDEIRDALDDRHSSPAMTEAVAERGEGVRETFVLGIRMALDRVRALWTEGALERLPPDFESGAELLAAIVAREGGDLAPPAAIEPIAVHEAAESGDAPRLPDASIPPGLVWPPVNGRAIVHEAARNDISLDRDPAGAWHGVSPSGRWHVSSPQGASFRDLEEGRSALIAWARWHVASGRCLSPERAVVLAPAGGGEWRLWQIVRVSHTLRDMCRDAVHLRGAAAGQRLFEIIDRRRHAGRMLTGVVERVALDTVSVSAAGESVYAAGAPYPPPSMPADERAGDDDRLIEREVVDALRAELSAVPEQLSELLAGLEAAAFRIGQMEAAHALRRGLLQT